MLKRTNTFSREEEVPRFVFKWLRMVAINLTEITDNHLLYETYLPVYMEHLGVLVRTDKFLLQIIMEALKIKLHLITLIEAKGCMLVELGCPLLT